jgi:hypothetical protein
MNPMRKNSSNVSENNRTIGMLAIAAFLMLFASTLGVGWVSLGAVAGTSDIDEMGDPIPEPTGGWGSGWINDTVTEVLGVTCRNPAIATGPGGDLHAVFACDVTMGGWNIFYSTSTDGGETWSPQVIVAGSPDDETNPDIAVNPDDGRMFVVYQRLVADQDIWSSWSDDGITWNLVSVAGFAGDDVEPCVTVEHNIASPLYYVYMAFEAIVDTNNRNVLVYRSTDRGLSWGMELNHGGADTNVYSHPDITYQHGTDGSDYLFVAFRQGVDAGDIYSISIIWSTDYAVTWSAPFTIVTETDFVRDLSIAGSRDGDKLVIVYAFSNAGDQAIKYSYDQDPTTPTTGWTTLIRGNTWNNGLVDGAPEVRTDGEGTQDVTIGGTFHLVWSQGLPDYNVVYSTSPSTGGSFVGMAVVSNGQASQGFARKGLTTQLRGGTWYPCVTYAEFTGFYDIYYTTPGMRSMVDTNPSGLSVTVDTIVGNGPRFFSWPAGLPHTLDTTSPQAVGPTSQLSWISWSDGFAQSHMIMSGTVDINYTANFVLQYAVTIDSAPTGLNVWVDGLEAPTPRNYWWDDLSFHDLDVTSPQGVSPTRYLWNSWSDAGPQAHTIQVNGAATVTANFFTQHEVTILAWDQTNAVPLAGVPVYVDGPFAGNTPYTTWYYEGTSYDIGVENPYNDGFNDFNFADWDFGPVANPVPYIVGAPATLTANYDVAPSTDFSLEIAPLTRTIAPGGTTTYTITLTSLSGYAGDVQLGAGALPGTLLPPATATFLPNPATVPLGGQVTSTLTIDNTATVPDDIYTITVSGQDTVSAAISDSNATELIVITPTFTVTITPALRTIAPGQTTTYDVTVDSINNYAGTVDLIVAGLPGAVTGTFLPDPLILSAGGSEVSVLTIDNTAGEPDGVYPFTVTGDDGSITDFDGADLEISTVPFYSIVATPALRAVAPGSSTSFTLTATSVNTYAGLVDVSVSHGLTVADASLSWNKIQLDVPDGGTDFAVLTVDTTGNIAITDHTLTFYAADGAQNETDDTTLNISSTLPGSIKGEITDDANNEVEGADVELVDDNDQVVDTTTSDSNGEYEFTSVDPGTYTVRASKTGYEEDDRSVTVGSDDHKTGVDLTLGLGRIQGDVVDENGEGIPDATVEVYDENGDLVGTDTTDSGGGYRIDDLLLGTYSIKVIADGYETVTVEDQVLDSNVLNADDISVNAEGDGNFLADYWWLLLVIIIIVVVLILVIMLAKRKKPAPEEAPPEYATAQVPEEQAPYQEAPPEQQPYQETPPEQYPPQEPQPETYPEEAPPEAPPEGYPPEE